MLCEQSAATLVMPPMLLRTQFKHTPDAVLLVVASDEYDADDYINNMMFVEG
jgi:hypothetical protein